MLTRFRFGWSVLFLVVAIFCAAAEQPFSLATTPGELPKNIVPHHYAIQITPDLEKLTTQGSARIKLEVLQPAQEIVLNGLGLDITRATLHDRQDIRLKPILDNTKQIIRLKLPAKLPRGQYRLDLEFNGVIGEQSQGLFYVKYPTASGKKMMLGTQMEPSDARRMFPCWDEPVFRATYDLTVTLPEKFKAISNLPIAHETKLAGGLKQVVFATTPPMPSYLVALVAGELEEISGEAEGVQIRVITTEGKSEQGRYALEATKKLLAYYNDYFGIKYPLPKLDQIAIPGGFEGAMENWGAITYNESVVLYDPASSSLQSQRDVFVTVAHEMSHQWFGNLVTTAWWDDLWLNEGFATWMEIKATDHFNPDWQMWLSAGSDKAGVMAGDAQSSTHPIQQSVANESEANDAFDNITYEKGGAFLRMLENYLGPEEFRKGVHAYLSAHLYSNATTADLWNALEAESGKPIHTIASGWTTQPGLPVVSVEADCVNGHEIVSLKQKRFTVHDPNAKSFRWSIPISLSNLARPGEMANLLLQGKSGRLSLADCAAVIKVNAGDNGYYRVKYSPKLFTALKNNFSHLPAADRFNLLDDEWALVEANETPLTEYFELTALLKDEDSYAVWDQVLTALYLIDSLEQNLPGRAAFQNYACALLRPQFTRLGWDAKPGESANTGLLRTKIISGLGHFGDREVIAGARTRFAVFVRHAESLPPDLRPPVLKTAGRYGDKAVYDQLHELARTATNLEERQMYYSALAGALDPALARETLAISLTNETVPQEATDLVIMVANSGEQPVLAWDFARQHLKELMILISSFDRDGYIPSIFSSFADNARAKELETFVKKNISPDALARARQTADDIRFKAELRRRQIPRVDAWVKTQTTH